MSLHTFSRTWQPSESDDSLYIAWLRNNSSGFVLAFTRPDEFYVTLHRARCTHISRQRPSGAYTRGNYGKHCADTWQDIEQFMDDPRARVEECGTCSPPLYQEKISRRDSDRNDQVRRQDKMTSNVDSSPRVSETASIEQTKQNNIQATSISSAAKNLKSSLGSDVIEIVEKFCRNRLNLEDAAKEQGDPYQCVPVCVIDAVFSIGVRYESTKAVVLRFCTHFNIDYSGPNRRPKIEDQLSISDLLHIYEQFGIDRMTSEVYSNRHRTSTSGGILKSEAVLLFSQVLFSHNVDYLQDVDLIIGKPSFEADIMQIPGQRSGISLRYFYMNTGDDGFIKPDRMIQRFLYSALGRHLTFNDCHDAIVGAHSLLVNDYPDLTPKSLDHLIWQYERS